MYCFESCLVHSVIFYELEGLWIVEVEEQGHERRRASELLSKDERGRGDELVSREAI